MGLPSNVSQKPWLNEAEGWSKRFGHGRQGFTYLSHRCCLQEYATSGAWNGDVSAGLKPRMQPWTVKSSAITAAANTDPSSYSLTNAFYLKRSVQFKSTIDK